MAAPPSKLGPWRIGSFLGKGEFSSVYECSRDGDPTTWAIKVSPFVAPAVKGKERKDQTCCRLLSWENQIYSLHAQGVPFFARRPLQNYYGPNESGWRYVVLEKLDGGSLKDRLDEITSPDIAFSVAMRVLAGLQHLHSRQFVFRDLKPENIMTLGIDVEGRGAVLVDFGAATKFIDAQGKHYAEGGASVGTPLYMSLPVHMSAPPSRRDDLESLGYLLAWMLNGGDLPWKKAKSEGEVQAMKSDPKVIAKLVTGESAVPFNKFLKYVKGLSVAETPDYQLLMKILGEGGGILEGPIFGGKPKSPSKKRASVSSKPVSDGKVESAKSKAGPKAPTKRDSIEKQDEDEREEEMPKTKAKKRATSVELDDEPAVPSKSKSRPKSKLAVPVVVESEFEEESEEEAVPSKSQTAPKSKSRPRPKRAVPVVESEPEEESEEEKDDELVLFSKSKSAPKSKSASKRAVSVVESEEESEDDVVPPKSKSAPKTTNRTKAGTQTSKRRTPSPLTKSQEKTTKRARKSHSPTPTRQSLPRMAKSMVRDLGFLAGATALLYVAANMQKGSA